MGVKASKASRAGIAISAVMAVIAAGAANVQVTGADPPARSSTLPQGGEQVTLNPADFTTNITNPYWPMKPGNRWVYRETAPGGTKQRVVVRVRQKTKKIANGITARIVNDAVTERGKPVEITDDWYAQDKEGNVWYLGENTKEYENGKIISREGSFEAGKNGAQAGVIMPANPTVGLTYRQEYYRGHAEDKAEIMSLREQVEVPYGYFGPGKVVMTRDRNPLEPKVLEYKFFARGVGPVLAVGVSGGADREELVRFRRAK